MKTAGLNALGEFIEDCEFPQLSKQVLHVLGSEAPTTGNPGRYIRYIFNRVILEVPSVRAAAVSALAKLAAFPLQPTSKMWVQRFAIHKDTFLYCRVHKWILGVDVRGIHKRSKKINNS